MARLVEHAMMTCPKSVNNLRGVLEIVMAMEESYCGYRVGNDALKKASILYTKIDSHGDEEEEYVMLVLLAIAIWQTWWLERSTVTRIARPSQKRVRK